MSKRRSKPAFWVRTKPNSQHDIVVLRPQSLRKGQRFETRADVRRESRRSQRLLRTGGTGTRGFVRTLRRCRAGDCHCHKPFCPICGRDFRRWLIGEALRVTAGHKSVRIYTVLLKEAPYDQIEDLDPRKFRHLLRKRLERAGLVKVPVIGGFEIVYKANRRVWVFHINLIVIGGEAAALGKFETGFKNGGIDRPIVGTELRDPPQQISYVLKFSTYHRPFAQRGPLRSMAVPLNSREHAALVRWMGKFEFKDFLFLVNARRERGCKIVLRGQGKK